VSIAARRPVVLLCGVLVGWFVWGCSSAFAAAPEAPGSVVVGQVGAAKVIVRGVLNPGGEGLPGTYEFLYRETSAGSGCEGGFRAPEAPGIAFGFQGQEVAQELTGLSPSTEYTVCLLERNLNQAKGEEAISTPVKFRTGVVLEAPQTSAVTGVTSSSAKFQGVLNPGAAGDPGSYEFVYRQSSSECARVTSQTQQLEVEYATPAEASLGHESEVVPVAPVEAAGLLPNRPYTVCLVARNEGGEVTLGSPVVFRTLSRKPSVSSESFSGVGSTTATISAQVNTGGLETMVTVQYGTSTAYGSEKTVELASVNTSATVQLSGLQPGSEYHFRVTVANQNGSETSNTDTVFKTLPTETEGLPDGRVYEMVTPAENDNADVYVPKTIPSDLINQGQAGIPTKLLFEASSDGDAVTYAGDPTSGGNGNSGFGEGNEYLATRSAGGGWSQTNLQVLGDQSAYYQAFSSDLSIGIMQDKGVGSEQPLSSEAPGEHYKVLYKHGMGEVAYHPLFSKTVSLHRTPEELGSNGFPRIDLTAGGSPLAYVGGSENMERLFFEANDALVEGAIDGGAEEDNLYESVDGGLSLVNVLPDGGSEPNARFGSAGDPRQGPDLSHVISDDGSRAFWTGLDSDDLYMTENASDADKRVVQVDEAVGGGGYFWTATRDGSKVFFTKGDLYEYDVNSGVTTDLTPSVEVQGVIGASEDGEYVYYVDSEYHLNVWHDDSSKLIAMLSSQDGGESLGSEMDHENAGNFGDWQPSLARRTAEVTPDGHSIVFIAFESLTGYDNEMPVGSRISEVYIYDSETDRLTCVSCARNGEPPEVNHLTEDGEDGFGGFWSPSWSTTFLPQWVSSDGSRVLFDSSQPLVPQDTNSTMDVYEWERDGSGSCHEAIGCVYLLSGGVSSSTSYLAGESSSGNDVFIITRAQLASEDGNEAYDVYDARVDGSQPASPPVCSGTGCQGVPASPPVFSTPPSVTFNGVGNFPPIVSKPTVKQKSLTRTQKLARALKACEGKRAKRRLVCEKTARKRFRTPVKTGQKRVISARKGGKS
jgi:hypothetical protein